MKNFVTTHFNSVFSDFKKSNNSYTIKIKFYSFFFFLNIFNSKSRIKILISDLFSSLDDSLIFTIKKLS